jgi:hypothetical protein
MKLIDRIGIGMRWDMKLAATYGILKLNRIFTSSEVADIQPPKCKKYSRGTILSAVSLLCQEGLLKEAGWKRHAKLYELTPELIRYAERSGIIQS